MSQATKAPVPSIQLFQQYCAELINLKQFAQSPPEPVVVVPAAVAAEPVAAAAAAGVTPAASVVAQGPPAVAPANENREVTAQSRPAAIWRRLELLLDRQTMDAARIAGPIGVEFHREALYVAAVLTDEIFVHLEWEGRQY